MVCQGLQLSCEEEQQQRWLHALISHTAIEQLSEKREWINSHVVEVMSFLATEVATLTCANPFICQMSCLWAVFEFSFGCATIFAFDQKWPHSRNY